MAIRVFLFSSTRISKNKQKNLTLARFFRCSMWKRTKARFHNLKSWISILGYLMLGSSRPKPFFLSTALR